MDDQAEGELPQIPRFKILRTLGSGGMGEVYLARDLERGGEVALKVLRRAEPDQISRLNREFRTVAEVEHPNLVQLYELIDVAGSRVFTMEPINGVDFVTDVRTAGRHERAVQRPTNEASRNWTNLELAAAQSSRAWLPTEDELPDVDGIGLIDKLERIRDTLPQLARAIQKMHSLCKLHLDIKPHNVLVDRQGRLVVLDFGFARDVPRDRGVIPNPGEGTPAFVAPEVLRGEMVGYPADWYAVGVMLYEALTGAPPQRSPFPDFLGVRAQAPAPSVRDLVPELPEDLDELCRGLMDRDPHTRLGFDAVMRWTGDEEPEDTETREFREVLIGRGAEREALTAARVRARERALAQIVLVHGGSGIGKTALIRDFLHLAAREGAVVLDGRCHDGESVPFNALDRIVDALVRVLEQQPLPSHISPPLEDLVELAQMFPVAGALLPEAGRPPLSNDPTARTTRAFRALRDLLHGLAKQHELILFIDDIQRADRDSARLLKVILQRPGAPALLLVGAHRSDEGQGSELLTLFEDDTFGEVQRVEIGPMTFEDIRSFAHEVGGEAAQRDDRDLQNLLKESRGVPFFVEQSLRFTVDVDVLVSSLSDVLTQRLEALEMSDQHLLAAAAIAGGPTPQQVVLKVAGVEEAGVHVLARLRNLRMIRVRGPRLTDAVEVNHDRIQETVLRRLSAKEQLRLHLAYAELARDDGSEFAVQRLLKSDEPDRSLVAQTVVVLTMAHHLSAAHRLNRSAVPVDQVFRSLLAAGIVARVNGAYGSAVAQLRRAVEYVDGNTDPQLAWRARFELARALNLDADFVGGLEVVETLLDGPVSSSRQQALQRLRFESLVATQQMSSALDNTVHTLRILGVSMPRRPQKVQIVTSLLRTKYALWGRDIASLGGLPRMADPEALATMQTLRSAMTAAFVAEPDLFPLLVLEMVRTTLTHGLAPESALAFAGYGLILSGVQGDVKSGLAFGHLAQAVVRELQADKHDAAVETVCGAFLLHWCEPVRDSFLVLRNGWLAGRSVGDLEWAGTSASVHAHQLWFAGEPLERVHRTVTEYAALIPKLGQARTQTDLKRLVQLCAALRGLDSTEAPWSLRGRDFDADAEVNRLVLLGDRSLLASTRYFLGLLAYLHDDTARAHELIDQAEPDMGALVGSLNYVDFWYVAALVWLSRASETRGLARTRLLFRARAARRRLASWATMMPQNFQHMHDLVLAEELRVSGSLEGAATLYTTAAHGAEEEGHLLHAAMSWQAEARFLHTAGATLADAAWTRACDAWATWGAVGLASRARPILSG